MFKGTQGNQTNESARFAAELVEAMREPFAVLDGDHRLISASDAFYTRFRLRREGTLGAPIWEWGGGEWNTPAIRELFTEKLDHLQSIEDVPLEVRFPGTERPWVHCGIRPLRDGPNRISNYLCSFFDVVETEQRSHRAELMDRLRRTRGDVIALVDAETGQIVVADGGARELTGYTAGELSDLPLGNLIFVDDRISALEQIGVSVRSGCHTTLDCRIQHRDGRVLWAELSCEGCADDDGHPLIHIGIHDVTDRRRAEESVRWLSGQVRTILDSAADGIVGLNTSGRITFANPAAARLAGYRQPELLGRSIDQIIHFHDLVEPNSIQATLRDGLQRDIREATLRCSDGDTLPVELSCTVNRDRGENSGGVVVFRSIVERKRAEAAERRAQWLAGVGETTLAVRHEVNNPLTTLLAEAQLLEMGGNSSTEEREMIRSICGDARRIVGVIRRLAECQNDPAIRIEGDQRMLDLRA